MSFQFKSVSRRRQGISRREGVANHVDLRNAVGVSNFHAGDIPVADQLLGQMAADLQHGLDLGDVHNIGVVREHHFIHGLQLSLRHRNHLLRRRA